MSYSISTLLTRNLHDVFGENDHRRRRAAIDGLYKRLPEKAVKRSLFKAICRSRLT
jgi:hypothetical protein